MKWLVLAVASLTACHSNPLPTMAIKTALNLPEIAAAADRWNQVLDYPVFIQDDPEAPGVVLIEAVPANSLPGDELADEAGLIWDKACIIRLEEPSADQPHKQTLLIAHELGHCLGLPHSEDPNSVMYPIPPGKAAALLRRSTP